MTICVIGSLRDIHRIQDIAGLLRNRGHQVLLPLDTSAGSFADRQQAKREFMKGMYDQIKKCDTVLVVNDLPRGTMKGYIGPNSFLQLGLGMALGKSLFALEKWDENLPYNEELNAMGISLLDLKLK
jgi:nucleoside 2-deoxyribosyltransferase